MSISLDEMKTATELTREGRLLEATRILRRAMEGTTQAPDRGPADAARGRRLRGEEITDVAFRELPAQTHERPRSLVPSLERAGAPQGNIRPATFEAHRFAANGRTYAYRLYVYPEQLARSNSMRCWNWFDPSHQQRGRGEPAMIAALAADVVQRYEGDPRRVYVAGLSAGGAMAALAAQLYPDVFAAVAAVVPTIVFHGDSDRTVHPDNGRHLVAEAVARASASGIVLVPQEQTVTVAGRIVRRTTYSDPLGVPRIEHWDIPGGSHAWSGGRAAGTFTEPSGPSASGAMIDFFLAQQLPPDAPLAT